MTDEQMKQIARAANAVWQYIGDDILAVSEGPSIPRDDVIEVVIDADRLRQELSRSKIDQPAIDAWEALTYEEQSRLLAEHAFKYERYGY